MNGTTRGSIQAYRWSPDGTEIAYVDDLIDASPRVAAIWVAQADGSGQRALTGYGSWSGDPWWSPDGSRIYFRSDRDGDSDIFVMNPDGTGITKLTANRVRDFEMGLSSDGTKIVFARENGKRNSLAIFKMNADGSGQVQLTPYVRWTHDRFPTWSPDGSWIAFQRMTYSPKTSREAMYRMRSDGTGVLGLSPPGSFLNGAPVWSPDSTSIAFDTEAGEIWTVGVEGTALTKVTQGYQPDWQAIQ